MDLCVSNFIQASLMGTRCISTNRDKSYCSADANHWLSLCNHPWIHNTLWQKEILEIKLGPLQILCIWHYSLFLLYLILAFEFFCEIFFQVQLQPFTENTMKVVTTMPSLLHVGQMPMEPKQSLNNWRLMASNQEAVKCQRLVVRPELNRRSFWKSGLTVVTSLELS